MVFAGMLCVAPGCDPADDGRAEDTDGAQSGSTGGEEETDGATDPDGSGDTDGDTTGVSGSGPADDTAGETDGNETGGPNDDDSDTGDGDQGGEAGVVFTMGNEDGLNEIIMFGRDTDGSLERIGAFPTGGMGTGGGLGSQGAIALSDDGFLYVVNAGDHSVSSMRIYDDHLGLEDVVGSEGVMPTSLTVSGNHLYVLNADGPGSIAGFELDDGMMIPVEGAMQPLSGHEAPAPAQVAATPDGDYLVVTERATNQIVTYEILADGSLGQPVVNLSEGQTPFGLEFTSTGVFIVSEAFGGGSNPGASAASSYRVSDGGGLWTFSASIPSGQTAACWVAIVADRFAYTTNTGSNTLSGYEIDDQGGLELFVGGGDLIDLGEDQGPIDAAVSADDSYLYVLNAAGDNITGFAVADDGTLTQLGEGTDVPETAVGLAAR